MSLPTGEEIIDFITFLNAKEEGQPQPDIHPNPDLIDDDCGAFVEIGESVQGGPIQGVEDLVFERWLRIPVHGVEQWINKDGPAAINRTTKVIAFNDPALGKSTLRLRDPYLDEEVGLVESDERTLDNYFDSVLGTGTEITDFQYNSGAFVEGFLRGRVYFYDSELEEYKLTHHGYVGSYGPTDNSLLRKFYIYDPADLLRDIPVGKEFTDAKLGRMINFVINGNDDTGKNVGVENSTPFDITSIEFPSSDEYNSRTIEDFSDDGVDGIADFAKQFAIQAVRGERLARAIGILQKESKLFTRNRNNMVDVLNYIAKLIDGIWYFEPRKDGVALQIRSDWSNTDYGRTLQDQTQVDDPDKFTVEVKENSALIDIKPINTISVNGESANQLERGERAQLDNQTLESVFTETYPYAKLRYDPFYQAAGNRELGPTNVRTDAIDTRTAEQQAYEEFIAHVEETTEGNIVLFGDPMPLPYDFIDAVPACRGQQIENRDPLAYSINEVHHKKYAGQQFLTELGVHAKVEGDPIDGDESNFTIESEYRQAQ